MINKIFKRIFWRHINRLPSRPIYNRLRTRAIKKFYKNTHIGKNVLVQKNFFAPLSINLTIGYKTVIKSNFCLYYDPKSEKINSHNVSIGSNCDILGGGTFDCSGNIVVGNNVHMGRNVKIFTHDHILTDRHKNINDTNIIVEDVKIGDDVVIFDDVVILKGAEIPSGSVVGIRAVVNGKFVEENKVLAGIPAKIIKDRC